MKTSIAITSASLEKLNKNARLFSYLSTSFTKMYADVSGDEMRLYYKGNKSLLSFKLLLEEEIQAPLCFSIDITKFLSAIKKMSEPSASLRMMLSENPSNITIYSPNSPDKITFSVNFFDRNSSEITSLLSFFTEKESLFTTGHMLEITQEILDFASITNTYMSTINKNNAIVIAPDKLMYADRTVIVKMFTPVSKTSFADIKLHKFILGFMEFITTESNKLVVSNDSSFVKWSSEIDPDFQVIMAIDPCVIGIPDQSDIDAITPEDNYREILEISPTSLMSAIEFFSGLFEASVWKPITFIWKNDVNAGTSNMILTYSHPSTEVEKEPTGYIIDGTIKSQGATFTLISDSIKTLLGKMAPDGKVHLIYNDIAADEAHGAGVVLKYYNTTNKLVFEAVLAKLTDS